MHVLSTIALATTALAAWTPKNSTTLKGASGKSPLIGSCIGYPWLLNSTVPDYRRIASAQFNSITPENEMKWESIEPERNVFNWTAADAVVNFGRKNGQKIRGHTFVWQNQLAPWVNDTLTPDDLDAALKNHITKVMRKYKGKVFAWDVINEAFEENGTIRDTIFSKAWGEDLFAKSLKYARAADPTAKLYYNDYNIEGLNNKSDAVYALAKKLVKNKVPLDGVGFQAHFTLGKLPKGIKENIARFSKLGLDVAITELDIRQPLNATNDQQQYEEYKLVVNSCPQCVSITTWGFSDLTSWVPQYFEGFGAALEYDEAFNRKKAWYGIRDALASQPWK